MIDLYTFDYWLDDLTAEQQAEAERIAIQSVDAGMTDQEISDQGWYDG